MTFLVERAADLRRHLDRLDVIRHQCEPGASSVDQLTMTWIASVERCSTGSG
jgi:hypothetical protein